MLIALSFTIALFISRSAYGYPQMIREGYSNCVSCHRSPSGGGVLTPYGRSISEQVSTYAKDGEGNFLYGPELPEWLELGGDIRWINFTSKSALAEHSNIMWMQSELEAAVSPIPKLWIVATIGRYEEGSKYEYRSNYLLLNISNEFSMRFGKFLPAYGLNIPDHRAFINAEKNAEVYAAEARYTSQFISLTATGIGKRKFYLEGTDTEGYKTTERLEPAASASFYISQLKVGSYFRKTERGAFLSAGLLGAYLLCQLTNENGNKIYYSELGYQILNGLDIFAKYQAKPNTQSYSTGLNWFPRPHWQLLVEVERSVTAGLYTDSLLGMVHYNL